MNAIENMNAALASLNAKAAQVNTSAEQDRLALLRSIVQRNAKARGVSKSDRLMPTLAELAEIC